MTTAFDIVQDALESLKVYGAGEDIRPADAARGLIQLNRMVDSFSNESLTTYAIREQSAPLINGKNRYSIGPGGDFDMERPLRLLYGTGTAYLLDSNANRYSVDVFPQDRWNMIWNIQRINSNLPNTIFYDPQFPLAFINVYPKPNVDDVTLFWDSYLPLSRFESLVTEIILPPGYEEFFESNLAIRLNRFYPTAVLSADLVAIALESKANIKRTNQRENLAGYDKDLAASRTRPYNIYSDTYR